MWVQQRAELDWIQSGAHCSAVEDLNYFMLESKTAATHITIVIVVHLYTLFGSSPRSSSNYLDAARHDEDELLRK